ncbi:uncharacterized protein LOC144107938 isoform X2 [Amblyomma americanum]
MHTRTSMRKFPVAVTSSLNARTCLLQRGGNVSCWNSEHGCDFVGPLGKLLEHFEQRCDFHAASCPRCRDTMPRKDLPRHYSAGCIAVASPEANLQEPAAAQQSASRRLDLPVDCCHDVLASVQSRANELAEALRGLSTEFRQEVLSEWGVISASLRETVSAVTETSVELSRIETLLGTHCSSLRAAQSVHASAPVAAASLEGSTLVESRGGNTSAANEQHIVWTVLFPHSSNYHYRENCFACSQVALDGTCARLNLMCEHSYRTDFLIVYAESTRPNECVVVSVKPFTCDSQTSPSYWHKSRWQNSKPQGPPLTLRYMASLSSHRPTVIGDINKFDFIISVNQCAH